MTCTMCNHQFCWYCTQNHYNHVDFLCVIYTGCRLAAFIIAIFFIFLHIDISYGFKNSLKLTTFALSWTVQDLLRFCAAWTIGNKSVFFVIRSQQKKLNCCIFFIAILTVPDFMNLMFNILFFELLVLICLLPMIFISLISLVFDLIWIVVTLLKINLTKHFIVGCCLYYFAKSGKLEKFAKEVQIKMRNPFKARGPQLILFKANRQ